MSKLNKLALGVIALLLLSSNCFAIVGAGFHWGFDYSTSMNNVTDENLFSVRDLGIDTIGGVEVPASIKDMSFMSVSRVNFDRTPINFGGKVFIDILPVEFEVSMNFGVWEYDGSIKYMTGIDGDGNPTYETQSLSIKELSGGYYFGVDKTPYGKMNLDFTLKKTFKKIPIIKPSIGAGVSTHFATPVLSADLVNRALNLSQDLSSIDPEELFSPDNMKKILNEITEGAKKPKTGMHFLIGLKVKPPVIPLAVYADGKYMIMFNDIEDGVGVNTKGFLLNVGLLFNI